MTDRGVTCHNGSLSQQCHLAPNTSEHIPP